MARHHQKAGLSQSMCVSNIVDKRGSVADVGTSKHPKYKGLMADAGIANVSQVYRPMTSAKLSTVDLFCGSGGMSAGFIDAGIDVSAAFDNWSAAVATYQANISNHASTFDLSQSENAIEIVSGIKPDIIAGGPPCQDFSSAGKRVEGTRANMTEVFGEIVASCKPRFFLMENVPMARKSEAYAAMKKNLQSSGYTLVEVVLDASRCGVPQARKRFFAFGSAKVSETKRFWHFLHDRISDSKLTVKEYLGGEIDVDFYYRHPRNYSRRSVFSVLEPSPTVRGVNRPVPPGCTGNHLDSAPPHTVRPLTSRERSRIQTFPRSWQWSGGDRNADVELQIGNAVPVNLASFVASGIVHAAA